ncbi:AraC family transcriptional regulator [Oceanobacter antarcticus]|uniref:Helix-turn-helix domain-containing protein n=1 Tax=Oceanobacter antarcticus TaxID=3133425 RepID=A0ABW8NFC6_9GAMM
MPDASLSISASLALVPSPERVSQPRLEWRMENRAGTALFIRPAESNPLTDTPTLFRNDRNLFGKLMLSELHFAHETPLVCHTSEDSYFLLLVMSGSCDYHTLTGQQQLTPGAVLLLNPGDKLPVCYQADCHVTTLSIPQQELLNAAVVMGCAHSSMEIDFLLPETGAVLPEALYHIIRSMWASATRPITETTRQCYEQLLYDALMNSFTTRVVQPGLAQVSKHPQIEQVRHRVIQHITEDFDVREIAAACKVSVKTLYNLFNRELGITPSVFIRNCKLEAAYANIQQHPEHNITHIATRYGFTNLSRFSAYYRERYGESPSDTLRKRRQQQATS